MTCTSACLTQDHKTYGECLKAKSVKPVGLSVHVGHEMTKQKAWDKELGYYEKVTKQGIQPAGTSTKEIAFAERASNEFQKPYRADVV